MNILGKCKTIAVFCVFFVLVVGCTALFIKVIAADKNPDGGPAAGSQNQEHVVDQAGKQDKTGQDETGQKRTNQDETNQGEADVRSLVEEFGKTLQKVSVTAPKDIAAATIEENYKNFVTPELLEKWKADPGNAPGRVVSSPWPDRIEILKTEMTGESQYTVYGDIIEITSVELVKGGAAAKRQVTIVVLKVDGRWLISDVKLGEYMPVDVQDGTQDEAQGRAQDGAVVYENTRYGFSFYLPESWKGYSIVEEIWEGTNDDGIVQTGPKILIRHPLWTQEVPRQDIPIMVFSHDQWNALQEEKFAVGAAPIGPTKLGSNSKYVFALPARYNFAFPIGFEEVEEILKGNPLKPNEKALEAFPPDYGC